jgi:hypothetical protein
VENGVFRPIAPTLAFDGDQIAQLTAIGNGSQVPHSIRLRTIAR